MTWYDVVFYSLLVGVPAVFAIAAIVAYYANRRDSFDLEDFDEEELEAND